MALFITLTLLLITGSIDGQICSGNEWKLYKDTYYWPEMTKMTYDKAKDYCQWPVGGQLAMPKTKEENEFIAGLTCDPPAGLYRYWIGMNDKSIEDSFWWEDGSYVSLQNWAPKEPNDNFGQDCVAIITSDDSDQHGKLSTMRCSDELFSLCTKKLVLPSLDCTPTIKEVGKTHFNISWSEWHHLRNEGDKEITGYMVHFRRHGGETWSNTGFVPAPPGNMHGSAQVQDTVEFRVDRIEPGTEYDVMVTLLHKDSGREGRPSPVVKVKTAAVDLPYLNTAPKMSDVSTSSFTISWSSWMDEMDDGGDGPIAGYVVNLKNTEAREWFDVGYVPAVTMSSANNQHAITVTCLKAHTSYHVTVSVIHAGTGLEGKASPVLEVRTSERLTDPTTKLPTDNNPTDPQEPCSGPQCYSSPAGDVTTPPGIKGKTRSPNTPMTSPPETNCECYFCLTKPMLVAGFVLLATGVLLVSAVSVYSYQKCKALTGSQKRDNHQSCPLGTQHDPTADGAPPAYSVQEGKVVLASCDQMEIDQAKQSLLSAEY